MTAASTPLGVSALRATMIPMTAPRTVPLGAAMISASATNVGSLRTAWALVTTTSLRTPRATESLESNPSLRTTTTALCGFAAFLPHLNHVLWRACLTATTMGASHSLLHHLTYKLRRTTLRATAAAGAGSSTLPRLERALFHLGNAIVGRPAGFLLFGGGSAFPCLGALLQFGQAAGGNLTLVMVASGVLAVIAIAIPAVRAVIVRHQGGRPRPDEKGGRHAE